MTRGAKVRLLGLSFVVVMVFVKIVWVEPLKIDGSALEPNLHNGDRVFVNKQARTISRGDIVMFRLPQNRSVLILLRVAGLPGERVQLREGNLYIDGNSVPEPYVSPDHNLKKSSTGEIAIPTDSYFVLGDNRDDALDSRAIGPVPRELIYGRFMARYWPM